MGDLTKSVDPPSGPLLLLTKLHPPPERDQAIIRERLMERLQPTPGVKLTVVAAPAGFGKTMLLARWREEEASRRPIAWLTLDEGDSDAVVLWSYVLAALERVCPEVRDIPSPQTVGAARVVDVVLPQLVNVFVEQGGVALILDDFHRLSSGEARDSVAWLVEHAPAGFQLILSTRSEPALPLASMRAHGELLEVRGQDLGFTPDEADELLNGRLDLGLARDDVDDLVERTEGWPAGLYLAALSLAGLEDRRTFLSRFDGGSRHILNFLVDDVLEAHEPSMQTLMLQSSVAERLCGPLCDAVLDQVGAAEKLQGLARTNLFLVPLDDRGDWYRFHHLFADLLRVELEPRHPGLALELHRRAYAWHREHGSPDEAVEHALQAGAFQEAAELLEASWVDYANVGRYATVLAWLRRFPPEVLEGDSLLLAVQAWVLSLCARQEEAARAIAAVEQLGGLDRGPLPDGFGSLEASVSTLRAVLPWGDVGSMYNHATRAAELEGPESPYRSNICWAMGMASYYRDDLDAADRWHEDAARLAPLSEQWLIAGSALAYRSLIAGERGQLEAQAMLAEEAVTLAREREIEEVDGEVFIALGTSLAARSRRDEALPHLERALRVLRAWGQPLDLAEALIRLIPVVQALGDRERAAALAAEARATVDSCPDPGNLEERLSVLERSSRARSRKREPDSKLSDRERAVLRMLSGSLSERDIGRELYLSHNTVHSHTRSIYRKLGVSSRAEAVEAARARRLI